MSKLCRCKFCSKFGALNRTNMETSLYVARPSTDENLSDNSKIKISAKVVNYTSVSGGSALFRSVQHLMDL